VIFEIRKSIALLLRQCRFQARKRLENLGLEGAGALGAIGQIRIAQHDGDISQAERGYHIA